MKKNHLIFLLAIALANTFCCCNRVSESLVIPEENDIVSVSLEFILPDAEVITPTRSADISGKDISLWLYRNDSQTGEYHYFEKIEDIGFLLPVGSYDIFAVANTGKPYGPMTKSEIESLNAAPPMNDGGVTDPLKYLSTHREVEIGVNTILQLELKRSVSKVNFNIRIGENSPVTDILSAQLCSVPGQTGLFTNCLSAEEYINLTK